MNKKHDIAQRVIALREDKGMSIAQVADLTGITEAEYRSYEQELSDIPMGWLTSFAKLCGVSTTNLLTGSDPHAQVYHITRKGTGPVVERRNEYHYESLAAQFAGRAMDPFVVTVQSENPSKIHYNTHPGNEFNLVLSGKLLISIDGHDVTLEAGDSIYFDSSKKHGMAALDKQPASFLAIICDCREAT